MPIVAQHVSYSACALLFLRLAALALMVVIVVFAFLFESLVGDLTEVDLALILVAMAFGVLSSWSLVLAWLTSLLLPSAK